jgi:hypothetical protein
VEKGTLCAVTVSGYEQGLAAGKIARGILVEGKKPSDFPFEPTTKDNSIHEYNSRPVTSTLSCGADIFPIIMCMGQVN